MRKKILALCLAIALVASSLAGCGKSKENLEIVSSIDFASVELKDNDTYFNCVAEDGTVIRFMARNGSVEEGCVTLEPGGLLLSLDAIGQIHAYTQALVEEAAGGMNFLVGIAYNPEGMESVSDYSQLVGSGLYGVPVSEISEDTLFDLSRELPNYVYVENSNANPGAMRIRSLTIDYDPGVKDSLSAGIKPMDGYMIPLGEEFNDEMVDYWPVDIETQAYNYRPMGFEDWMESAEGLSCLELVSAIDRSSITADGQTVYFNAVTPEGQILRFMGEGVEIKDDSLVFHYQSKLYSLDSIGQIHAHDARYMQPESQMALTCGYGYTFDDLKRSVDSPDELVSWGLGAIEDSRNFHGRCSAQTAFLSNFVYISNDSWEDGVEAEALMIYYDPAVKTTGLKELRLNPEFYGYYIEGQLYDAYKESRANLQENELDFYLIGLAESDTASAEYLNTTGIYFIPEEFFTVGDLKDAQGNVLDKNTAAVSMGCTLDVTVGGKTFPVELPVVPICDGSTIATNSDRVPYVYPNALGQVKNLVIPLAWNDQPEDADMNWVYSAVGRVVDENGNVTDYSSYEDEITSLSEYYDAASYGKLEICSFVTDFYDSSENYTDVREMSMSHYSANQIMEHLYRTYPDMDWSQFDADGNGYLDSVVFLGTGQVEADSWMIISYCGAYNQYETYFGDYAGTSDLPRINCYTYTSAEQLTNNFNTLHHEYAHGLGLIDYYDVGYSGINAVGAFDMQSGNYGDWNCYSKLSVGWIDPMVVEDLATGESVEFTIGSSALHGDAIVIPAAGKTYDGPFGEYMMVDLFTDDGLNRYDVQRDGFELGGAAGVRISHVSAQMEVHTEVKSSVFLGMDETPVTYQVATPHYVNSHNPQGKYHIEVIQAGGVNTFTNPEGEGKVLTLNDLFYAGDSFSMESHGAFFADGRMDDGSDFGYIIEIVDIYEAEGETFATVRITRQ